MEVWKDAAGFEGYLKVSNTGRCISLGRWVKNHYGEMEWKPEREIAPDGQSKYKSVSATIDGKKKCVPLHRVIAETFIPNPDNLPQVNHVDGNTHNNAVENLEWCTPSENIRHAYRTGLADPVKISCGLNKYHERVRKEKEAERMAAAEAEENKRVKREKERRKAEARRLMRDAEVINSHENMTKNERIQYLEEEVAHYQKDKDPYYEEQSRLIRKMPIEIIKFRIPKES